MTPPSRLPVLIIGGFILASFANVFWELRVAPEIAHGDPSFILIDNDRLATVARTSPGSSYGLLYLAPTGLLEVAGDGVLIVPDPEIVDEFTINNLARMSITADDYQTELTGDEAQELLELVRFEGTGLIGGPGSELLDFHIVADPNQPKPEQMRLMFHQGAAFFVAETLLEPVNS